jgi:hypothetical protein
VAKHHLLPAAYLGGFSLVDADRMRERPIWVGRRTGRPFQQKAENVALRADNYTVSAGAVLIGGGTEPSSVIDDLWSGAENSLREIIDGISSAVSTGLLELRIWLMAVELLTQFFVRTAAYDDAQTSASKSLPRPLTRDEVNGSRIMNLQRLRPAVLHGAWLVRPAPSGALVTNDCGYTPVHDVETDSVGYAFPLSHDLAVFVHRAPIDRTIIKQAGWLGIEVGSLELSGSETLSLNRSVAANAVTEVFGPSETVVHDAQQGFQPDVARPGPDLLVPSSSWLREHELDWFDLLDLAGLTPPRGTAIYLPTPPMP